MKIDKVEILSYQILKIYIIESRKIKKTAKNVKVLIYDIYI